jgi:hypothetical protein
MNVEKLKRERDMMEGRREEKGYSLLHEICSYPNFVVCPYAGF